MRRAPGAASGRTFRAALDEAVPLLQPVSPTPQLDAQLLLAEAAGVSRSAVLAFPERELDGAAALRFGTLLARRAAGEPLAYLQGRRDFFSLTLDLTPAVLVPRPETEHLVEEALRHHPGSRVAVLDLGTGSGALALAVKAQRPDADVTGADASAAALEVARANGERLGLDVRWVESDWFDGLEGFAFDAILCNPPYVRSDDPHFDGPLSFEPRAALDGGPDGFDAIRAVLAGAPRHLQPGGVLLLEHGYDQQARAKALAAEHGFDVLAAGRDLSGLDRYLALGRPR